MDNNFEHGIEEPSNVVEQQKKSYLAKGFLAGLVIVLIIYGGYLTWKNSKLDKEILNAQETINAQITRSEVADNQQVSLQSKKLFLATKKESQLLWTNILSKFYQTIEATNSISIGNFSGNADGNLSFSANTTLTSFDPYLDTALLITQLKSRPYFTSVFIPSISSSITEQGQETLAYSVRLNYIKEASDNEIVDLETLKEFEENSSNINTNTNASAIEARRQELINRVNGEETSNVPDEETESDSNNE